jgi:hypothetical protein
MQQLAAELAGNGKEPGRASLKSMAALLRAVLLNDKVCNHTTYCVLLGLLHRVASVKSCACHLHVTCGMAT